MKNLPVITISRQSGSRGREAGQLLAQQLGIPYYDYQILAQAAKESGLPAELFEGSENSAAALLERLTKGQTADCMTQSAQVFEAQAAIIRKLAAEGPAVFVGRCADSVLKDMTNVVNIYTYASMERRIANTVQKKAVNEKIAALYIRQVDAGRSAYHTLFGAHPWGEMSAYDLCICTDHLTPQETASAIAAFVENWMDKQN